jgi:anti-anti-sigma factor
MSAGPDITIDRGVHVIQLESRYDQLDPARLERLQAAISGLLQDADSKPRVVMDLGQTEYFTSDLVGAILQSRRAVIERGGQLVVCNLSDFAQQIFEVTKVNTLCQVYETRDEAVTKLSAS